MREPNGAIENRHTRLSVADLWTGCVVAHLAQRCAALTGGAIQHPIARCANQPGHAVPAVCTDVPIAGGSRFPAPKEVGRTEARISDAAADRAVVGERIAVVETPSNR